MNKLTAIHHLTSADGDTLDFYNYGLHGITVRITQGGDDIDFGMGPDDVPTLIKWLTAYQQQTLNHD